MGLRFGGKVGNTYVSTGKNGTYTSTKLCKGIRYTTWRSRKNKAELTTEDIVYVGKAITWIITIASVIGCPLFLGLGIFMLFPAIAWGDTALIGLSVFTLLTSLYCGWFTYWRVSNIIRIRKAIKEEKDSI